ncbi:hypothetical protein AVEN_239066-1 [Araneus ventricosus]|uniref:MATH domain-containing protein n=1 Tax=Araneus ventricosus TaxID=182803 RepID=A0A4Y2IMG2_ARAVE|nr:hypothetical protein AVEN_239066-1 [Araneus ventricosus]
MTSNMAENGNVRTISNTDTPDGHDIHRSFRVENVSAVEPWVAQNSYLTECEVLPTSWFFQMTFQQAPENGPISWSVSLRRNDSNTDRPVKAFIWISFFDASGQLLRFPKKLSNDGMLPGDEIYEYIPLCLPSGGLMNLPEQKLDVEVSIFIRFCHMKEDGTDAVANLSDDLNRMCFLWFLR